MEDQEKNDATKENGWLWAIPGSHKHGNLKGFEDRGVLGALYTDTDLIDGEAVATGLSAGSVLYFHRDGSWAQSGVEPTLDPRHWAVPAHQLSPPWLSCVADQGWSESVSTPEFGCICQVAMYSVSPSLGAGERLENSPLQPASAVARSKWHIAMPISTICRSMPRINSL
ncbi:MAG: phytanoyl-CoA dioxygenase family protein [bacterium]|nr:phytanoyl-CoA dioxygenase family protein [bacterium]